jgi:transposase-like protein
MLTLVTVWCRFPCGAENFIPDTILSTTYNSTNMAAIDEAIEELNLHEYTGKIPYQAVARKYGVVDTTLRRRHRAETQPWEIKYMHQQLLTPEQEAELIQWINEETKGKQPPARFLVAEKASLLAGRDVGVSWVYCFLQRHADVLVFKNAAPMDCLCHQANSHSKYEAYFTYLIGKLQEYQIPAKQTYNIDEKGIAMGIINRSKRVFSRKQWERKVVQAPLQDGSQEWISILACICANGTTLLPGLIY